MKHYKSCEITNKNKSVTIIWRFLPQYKYDFFNRLRDELSKRGICLNLIYGKNRYVPRKDEVEICWATSVENRTLRLGRCEFYWLSLPKSIFCSDLLILMQENRIFSNYPILLKALILKKRIAFWDHGLNHQANPYSPGNFLKRFYSTWVSWWFAYTEGVAEILIDMGFPKKRITVVENAIDTEFLRKEAQRIRIEHTNDLRKKLGIDAGPLGLFCGGMYKEKRLDFLLESCRQIKARIPGFEMIFIGAGPDEYKVREFMAGKDWIHYVGPQFGGQRVPYFLMADALFMPGAVGLGILDSFALETPMITTKYAYHGPEIEYLKSGLNGIMTDDSIHSYVEEAISLLSSAALREKLRKGCRESAKKYTITNMINNFCEGIIKALPA